MQFPINPCFLLFKKKITNNITKVYLDKSKIRFGFLVQPLLGERHLVQPLLPEDESVHLVHRPKSPASREPAKQRYSNTSDVCKMQRKRNSKAHLFLLPFR